MNTNKYIQKEYILCKEQESDSGILHTEYVFAAIISTLTSIITILHNCTVTIIFEVLITHSAYGMKEYAHFVACKVTATEAMYRQKRKKKQKK